MKLVRIVCAAQFSKARNLRSEPHIATRPHSVSVISLDGPTGSPLVSVPPRPQLVRNVGHARFPSRSGSRSVTRAVRQSRNDSGRICGQTIHRRRRRGTWSMTGARRRHAVEQNAVGVGSGVCATARTWPSCARTWRQPPSTSSIAAINCSPRWIWCPVTADVAQAPSKLILGSKPSTRRASRVRRNGRCPHSR